MAIILGIDPGSRFTGWGVVNSQALQSSSSVTRACLGHGVIVLGEKQPLAERLSLLMHELQLIIEKFKPSEMSVEKVFLGRNADSAFKLGHARGVVLAMAGRNRLHLAEYATRFAKKMLTGSGAATKEQVHFVVTNLLRVQTTKLDATDALALAVCHSREREVAQVLRQQNRQISRQNGQLSAQPNGQSNGQSNESEV